MKQPRLDDYMPSVFAAAETASQRGQQRYKRGTMIVLFLLIVAAAFGLVEESWAGWASGAAFLTSLVATGLVVLRDAEDDWYDGRAVAESAKTLTWKYAVGGEPFGIHEQQSRTEYARALAAILDEIRTLHGSIPSPSGPNHDDRLTEMRGEPLSVRRQIYREQRLCEQRTWYGQRGRDHRSTARTWQAVAAGLQGAGLVCAALKGFDVVQLDLLSVFAAAGAGAIAWLAAGDYVKTARAYQVTALELDQALTLVDAINDEPKWATFVADAEQTMSREHTGWLARRRGPR